MEILSELCREHVVGLDFSRGMLSVARQSLAAAPGSVRPAQASGGMGASATGAW